MARKRASAKKPLRGRISRWTGLGLLALAVFSLASLVIVVFFLRTDPETGGSNLVGDIGRGVHALLASALGWVGMWSVPVVLGIWGWNRLRLAPWRLLLLRTLGAVPVILLLLTAATALGGGAAAGGRVGNGIWTFLHGLIGSVGGGLLLAVLTLGFILLETEVWDGRMGNFFRSLGRLLRRLVIWAGHLLARGLRATGVWIAELARGMVHREEEDAEAPVTVPVAPSGRGKTPVDVATEAEPPRIVDWTAEGGATRIETPTNGRGLTPAPDEEAVEAIEEEEWEDDEFEEGEEFDGDEDEGEEDSGEEPGEGDDEAVIIRRVSEGVDGENDLGNVPGEARRRNRPSGKKAPAALFASAQGEFTLPTPELLDDVPEVGRPVPSEELVENSRILTETLRDFGISGRVGEVHPGPVITRYEFTPGPGVRVAQITNRTDDLALKLRAIRIRIVAPIPGKAAVGIEVPNKNPVTIYLRKLLEADVFRDAPGPLTLALGKDINGYPVVTELTKMPHLLIAGTTGSGKSVCVNSIITSLLLKHGPDSLRMLMIDPKMLELPMYNGIPHLLTDVVTDPKLAARSLKWLLLEMERRYKLLAARGSRNIQSYNTKFEKDGPLQEGEELLPYIVVIIDELADLMITSGNEVEEPIARLAQTARAVGIHLIVATQRPSVDVITGVIKANFPTRIAFQVASRTDSRTILDQNGAESLLGRGDMLFLPPGTGVPHRVHGAFVTESETQGLADFIRKQGEAEEHAGLANALTDHEVGSASDLTDPRFEDAARLVVAIGQGSASLLQRRLKVGYARAARLVDMLESAGVVAPADGSKSREVLLDDVRLEHLLRERDQ